MPFRPLTAGLPMAALGLVMGAGTAPAGAQELQVITVPWLGDPDDPHQVYEVHSWVSGKQNLCPMRE